MMQLIKSNYFSAWLDKADSTVKARVLARLSRVESGNLGDHRSVGDGINELRLFFGAGFRIYYIHQGEQIIVLLCAGDKSTQTKDIQLAKQIAADWR